MQRELRLEEVVRATDGPFGEIADIVIEPAGKTITHLVVEPHGLHRLARLVPMWLVTIEDDHVTVGLDAERLIQLEKVAFSEFIEAGEQLDVAERLDVGGKWDIGINDFVSLPFVERDVVREFGVDALRTGIEVTYDRIPKGVCEVRRRSDVRTTDDHVVGHVDGFLTDGDQIVAVLVHARLPAIRRHVVVPVDRINEVRNDLVGLTLNRSEFRALPHTTS